MSIPTSSQATVTESSHLLRLKDSIEIIRNGWTVKDYQSFQPSSHLTKKDLATMVESAVLHYNLGATSGQDFFVSDTLIEELDLKTAMGSALSVNSNVLTQLVLTTRAT